MVLGANTESIRRSVLEEVRQQTQGLQTAAGQVADFAPVVNAMQDAVTRNDPGPSTDGRVMAYGPNGEPKSPLTAVYAENRANIFWNGEDDDTPGLVTANAVAVALGVPLVLPPGVGMVTTLAFLDSSVVRGPGSAACVIRQHSDAVGASDVTIDLSDTTNVSLSGFAVDGNKSAFAAVSTEHKHAIDCRGVTRLTMDDVWAINPKGDGLYFGVGSTGTCTHVRATNVITDGAHRNGCSIISMDDGVFTGCSFLNSSGTDPQAGLDIEPNFSSELIRDLRFIGCTIDGNAHEGVIITLKPGGAVRQGQIRFSACAIRANGWHGVQLYRSDAASFTDCDVTDNALHGYYLSYGNQRDIAISGGTCHRNGYNGIYAAPDDLPNIQTIRITGNPTGGSFTLTFDGQTTHGIAYNATAAHIKAEIEDLSNVALNDIIVQWAGQLPSQTVIVQFKGTWAGVAAPLMTASSSLAGGSSPAISVTAQAGRITNLRIVDVDIQDNGQAAANTYDGINLSPLDSLGGIERPYIRNVVAGNVQGSTQRRALTAANDLITNLSLVENDFRNNLSQPLLSDAAGSRVQRDNLGITTVATIATTGTMTNFANIVQLNPTDASDDGSGAFTVTLPAVPRANTTITLRNTNGKTDTSNVTITANVGQTIRLPTGMSSPLKMTKENQVIKLLSDSTGANWYVEAA